MGTSTPLSWLCSCPPSAGRWASHTASSRTSPGLAECRRKTTSCIAITNVESNDRSSLSKLVESVKTNYNERGEEIKRHWGGGSLGNKSAAKVAKVEKIKAKELAMKI